MLVKYIFGKNTGEKMSDEQLIISIRKFLKKVGITSQKEIERVYDGIMYT